MNFETPQNHARAVFLLRQDSVIYQPEHPRFKSKICRHWLKGWCRLGDQCNFAHGWCDRRENLSGKPEDMWIELGKETPVMQSPTSRWKNLAME